MPTRHTVRSNRLPAIVLVLAGALLLLALRPPDAGRGAAHASPVSIERHGAAVDDEGYPIESQALIRSCGACHQRDEQGRMSRISYLRKTPEGWQASIRRMVGLHDVQVDPESAREIVRYLSNRQGLAPEELRPGRFEVERRLVDYAYADRDTERTCNACHSMGRVITERRTRDEWKLLIGTHRALYPLVDFQRFRRGGPPPAGATGAAADPRHPMDKAIEHLAKAFPLETPEWTAWSANLRPARLEGSWTLAGHDPARGGFFGQMVVRPVSGRTDEFTTEATYILPEDGRTVRRTGRAVVYTGYQWRGRSTAAGGGELREVMFVERGWGEMSGRWYTGDHDETGVDVRLERATRGPAIAGVHPRALRAGTGQEVSIFGANLPGRLSPGDVDFGPGVRVRAVSRATPELAVLRVDVAEDAALGHRDLYLAGVTRTDAAVVYDRVDAIRVRPRAGMARVGGAVMPRRFEQFEAVAYHNGPDGKPETEDDLELGRVAAAWSIEEYPVTFEDDDVAFVGSIDDNGFFTPAEDGPNPERSGNRNNIGEVWVVATYVPPGAQAEARPLRARAHLLVTVPIYMQWESWPAPELLPPRAALDSSPHTGLAGGVR